MSSSGLIRILHSDAQSHIYINENININLLKKKKKTHEIRSIPELLET